MTVLGAGKRAAAGRQTAKRWQWVKKSTTQYQINRQGKAKELTSCIRFVRYWRWLNNSSFIQDLFWNEYFSSCVKGCTDVLQRATDMDSWHSKSLGLGSTVYTRLKMLDELRHQLCPLATDPYTLMIDTLTAETIALFSPANATLGKAFGATLCARLEGDSVPLVDLGFQPLPANEMNSAIFSAASF
jgi:hypothetical protein